MTLNVTSNNIEIKNSLGNVKFSAREPLMHISGQESGVVRLGWHQFYDPGNEVMLDFFFPTKYEAFQEPLDVDEFAVIKVRITQTTMGQPSEALRGVIMPGNTVIPISIRPRGVNNVPTVDTTNLSVTQVGSNGLNFNLHTYRYATPTVPSPTTVEDFGGDNYIMIGWTAYKFKFVKFDVV